MAQRLHYPAAWAEAGRGADSVVDPDLDTDASSYIPNRYNDVGWKSEKPPHQWQNFLSQITDEKVIAKMVDGLVYYDDSVTYQEGAVYRRDNKYYKIEGGVEKEILSVNRAVYDSIISSLNTLLNNHVNADNPHNDTVDTLVDGSYVKSYVDDAFGSPTDPRTIVHHKLQTGALVHGETAESTGALPAATGGVFTGDVTFLNEAIVQITPSKYLHYNKDTAKFEIVNGTMAIGVDSAGSGYIVGTGGSTLMLSEKNLDTITIKYNNSFALPAELMSLTFNNGLSDVGVGTWTVDTDNDPVFIDTALKVDNNEAYFTNGAPIVFWCTLYLMVRDRSGVYHTVTLDVDQVGNDKPVPLYKIAMRVLPKVDIECIKQFVIYPMLTERQKLMLVHL